MNNLPKLDKKDYEILRVIDTNFRMSFSKIGKKVGLSKNSVSLRFEKMKPYMLHHGTGINYEMLGYKFIKVYYTFDYYNDELEKAVIAEVRRHKNIAWAARYFGSYDLAIGLYVKNLNDFIMEMDSFDKKLAGRITHKDIQIHVNQIYSRYQFIYDTPFTKVVRVEYTGKIITLSEAEKKILAILFISTRASIIEISRALKLSPKTVASKIKYLEDSHIIIGYFLTLQPVYFGQSTFKVMIQLQNMNKQEEFEKYISSTKCLKYFAKLLGRWDYELDYIFPSLNDMQIQVEEIRRHFPKMIKKVEIIGFGKRIATNKATFLL